MVGVDAVQELVQGVLHHVVLQHEGALAQHLVVAETDTGIGLLAQVVLDVVVVALVQAQALNEVVREVLCVGFEEQDGWFHPLDLAETVGVVEGGCVGVGSGGPLG